jgi:hypothetical protein
MYILSIRSDWEAMSARIDALVTANHAYLAAFIRKSDDPYGGHKELVEEAIEIFEELKAFQGRYRLTLPHNASESLNRLFERRKAHFTRGHVSGFEGLKVLIPAFAATRSAVDYHLRDFSVVARRITERAFIHLQRLIVADSDARQKWPWARALQPHERPYINRSPPAAEMKNPAILSGCGSLYKYDRKPPVLTFLFAIFQPILICSIKIAR